MVQIPELVTDLLFACPRVKNARKRFLFERKQVRQRAGKEILTGVAPPLTDILLLRLDGSYHCLIHQWNDMLSFGFPLVKTEIPFVSVIMDKAGKLECADFTNAHYVEYESNQHITSRNDLRFALQPSVPENTGG